jgi:CarD family transcriptional regulator
VAAKVAPAIPKDRPVAPAKAVAAAKSTPPAPAPAAAASEAPLRQVKAGATKPPPAPTPSTDVAPSRRPSGIAPKGYVPLVNIPPLPPAKNMNLEVGDKAVHPAHGLAEVIAIEHREIGGAKGEFYILRILDNGMRVMVPRASAPTAGLRPVMSNKEAEKVLETMRAREVAVDLQPWSRRFRAYTEMIKSGQPHEVAKVLRDMYRLKFDKDLSFGERRLLDQAKSLLMKELAAAKKMPEADLQAQVDDMFRT